jgi:hypothetical protein
MARSAGLAPTLTKVDVRAGEQYGPIELHLMSAATIRGFVVDQFGVAQPGAIVTLAYAGNVPMRAALASAVGGKRSANSDGSFQLTEIVPAVPFQIVAASGQRHAATSFTLQPGEVLEAVILRVE